MWAQKNQEAEVNERKEIAGWWGVGGEEEVIG